MFVIVTNVTLLFVVILDKIPENNQQKNAYICILLQVGSDRYKIIQING